jgi:hypothetical protein
MAGASSLMILPGVNSTDSLLLMFRLLKKSRTTRNAVKPRRQTPSIGIYSHVRDRWGIFNAQPLVLNEQRQAGADGESRFQRSLDVHKSPRALAPGLS